MIRYGWYINTNIVPTYVLTTTHRYMLQRIGKVLVIHRDIPSCCVNTSKENTYARNHTCLIKYLQLTELYMGIDTLPSCKLDTLYLQRVGIYDCLLLKQHQSIAKLKDNPISHSIPVPADFFETISNAKLYTMRLFLKYFFLFNENFHLPPV